MMRRVARILTQCFSLIVICCASCSALNLHSNLASIKVDAAPGESVNSQFNLTLAADQPQTQFHLHTQDFYRSEDGRQSFYKPAGTLTHSCANWVTINPVDITVQSGSQLNARLTINVPAGVKPGGYWCVLTVDEVPNPLRVTPKGIGMEMFASISVGVFVSVLPIRKSIKIEEVQIQDNRLTVKVTDTGDCPFSAEGRVEFLRVDDKTPLATATFPKTALFCEPINTAMMSAALPDEKTLPSGHYQVRVILDIGLDHYIGVRKDMDIDRVPAAPRI